MSFNILKYAPTIRNWLALEALLELAYARILRASVSFARLSKLFGEPQLESPPEIDSAKQQIANDVGLAIRRAVRYAPFRCNCLTQAICTLRMLKRRSVACTLYLGVTRGADVAREAHAWTRCGALIVTGENELDRYDAVFTFATR